MEEEPANAWHEEGRYHNKVKELWNSADLKKNWLKDITRVSGGHFSREGCNCKGTGSGTEGADLR